MLRGAPGPSIVLQLAGVGALFAACGGGHPGGPDAGATDAGHDATGPADAGAPPFDASGGLDVVAEAPGDTGSTALTFVRIADWTPDLVSFDFCAAPHGTTSFEGPLLAITEGLQGDGGSLGDAGGHGLAFPQVTTYLGLAPGQYDVRLVSAHASDCSVPVATEATDLPVLAANAYTTVVVAGDALASGTDALLTIRAFPDDTSAPGGFALRFINAGPSLPSVAFGTGSPATATFRPLFSDVTFATTGTAAETDAGIPDVNGYMALAGLSGTASVVATEAGTPAATASGLSLFTGAFTLAVVGGKTNGAAAELVECVDTGSTAGVLGDCMALTP